MQSKKQSLMETMTSTTIGFVGSWLIMVAVLQFVTDLWLIATLTTGLCTVWSIVRGYFVRRLFNQRIKEPEDTTLLNWLDRTCRSAVEEPSTMTVWSIAGTSGNLRLDIRNHMAHEQEDEGTLHDVGRKQLLRFCDDHTWAGYGECPICIETWKGLK